MLALVALFGLVMNASFGSDVIILSSCDTSQKCKASDKPVEAVESFSARFYCHISSNSSKTNSGITWLSNGKKFNIISTFVQANNHYLLISHVQTWMRGEFQCCWQARCSNKILMNVYVPPKLRGLSPSPNTNFPLHSTVTMIVEIKFCQRNHITSKNNFHCHWVKDEILVSGGTCNNEVNTTKPTQNITLTKPLVESNDTGCYQLLFSNAYGHWLSNRLCVNVTGPLPRVPYSVTAQAVRLTSGDSGINVSWTDSVSTLSSNHFNTGKIRHLVVQYRTAGAKVWKEDIIKTFNNHTHIIRHLLPCEPYEVTVTAVNQFGSSKPTPITEVTTTPNSTSPQFIIGKDSQRLLLKKYNSDPLMACIHTNISNDVIHSLCNLPATDSGNVPRLALHHDRVYVTNWSCSSSLTANNCYWTCPLLIATCPSGYNKFSIKHQCQHENPKHEKESQNIIAIVVTTVLGSILVCCLVAYVAWCKRSAVMTCLGKSGIFKRMSAYCSAVAK